MERPGPVPPWEILQGRSEEIGRRAELNAKNLFERNSAFIDPRTGEIVAEREKELAVQKYLEKRKAGLANDLNSKEPGMTLCVTQEGKERLEKIGKRRKFDVTFRQTVETRPDEYLVEFPTGIFAETFLEGFFAAETYQAKKHGAFESTKKRFNLRNEFIIRIEGKHGELWQNPNFNWDGSKKV